MNFGRPAGDSDDSDDEFGNFSFGGETKTFKQQEAETRIRHYKNRIDTNNTPENKLYNSIVNGNLSLVKTELDNGTNLNIKLIEDYTPLLLAASHSKVEIVKEIIDRGADIMTNKDGFNSLMAVCNCNPYTTTSDQVLEIVKLLIEKNLDAKMIDRKRCTALMLASTQGFIDVVKFLIGHSRLEMEDNQGYTAIFYAVTSNQPSIVKILIDAGSDIDHLDFRGNNIYYYASLNDFKEILELLPKPEEPLPTPDDLLDKITPLETIFENWNGDRRNVFAQDVSIMLYGAQCENLIPTFREQNIGLYEFLMLTNEEMKEMGARLQFQRDRILAALYKFHKHATENKSMPSVNTDDSDYSTYDMLVTMANSVKHFTVMEASLKYIEKNLKFHELNKEKLGALSEVNKNIIGRLRAIKCLMEMHLRKKVSQLDAVIPNQPDLITKNSKFKKYSFKLNAIKFLTLFGVSSVSFVLCRHLISR